MRAAVVTAFDQPLTLEERAVPEPAVGEVVVRIETSGLCHTDIHAAHGEWPVKPGLPFVIRIHHDAGYVVLPHTHPEDENITVLKGSWALGMGRRVKMSELEPMELGAFGFVPKKMAHFGYAKVETILQVHGIGPFINVPIDPVYELTNKGVLSKLSLVRPGVPTSSSPPDCFVLKMGARVRGARGEGIVVGGLCSPANQFTQYWIQKSNSERFWATLQGLKAL